MTFEDALLATLERLARGIDGAGLTEAAVRRRMHERTRRRRMRRTVASAGFVVAATLLGALGLLDRSDGGRRVLTSPAAPSSTAPLGPTQVPRPTLVAPTVVPTGLRFLEGGSTTGSGARGTVTLSSTGLNRPVQLTWWPLGIRGGCEELVATGPSPATDARRSRSDAIRAYVDGSMNQIGWCQPEGVLLVTLFGPDLPRQQLADLALTVAPIPGVPWELTVAPPAALKVARDVDVPRAVLMYGRQESAWPTLRVQIEAAGANALERARADRGGEPLRLGTRPALTGPDGILVLYDDHTLVRVSGTAVSEQEVRGAAESLAPADPSMAPPVGIDSRDGRCSRLGLCR